MAAAHHKRTDDWALPEHFHRYAHRYATKIRAEIQREESREWTVVSKEEPRSGNDTLAPSTRLTKNAKDEEARSVLPERISDSTEHEQAGLHRDLIYDRSDSSDGRRSLLHWQSSASTSSTATQTPNSVTDGRLVQWWRSTQSEYWLELQRLQRSIQHTLEQTRDPSRTCG